MQLTSSQNQIRKRNALDGQQPMNVGETERIVSMVGGAALLLYAVNRGSWPGLVAGVAGADLLYRGITGYCVIYDKMGMSTAYEQPTTGRLIAGRTANHKSSGAQSATGIHVHKAVTVNRPIEEVYDYWQNLDNLPNFMHHVQSVQRQGQSHSHWVVNVSPKLTLEWDAETTEARKNEVIGWRSLPGTTVENQGEVRFKPAPGQRGTEVHVTIAYQPPGGIIGETFARFIKGITEQQIKEDIRRFKHVLEAGEFPTIEGQPMGK